MYFAPGVLLPTLSLMINISGQARFGRPSNRVPKVPIAYGGPSFEYGQQLNDHSSQTDDDDVVMLQQISKFPSSPATERYAFKTDDELEDQNPYDKSARMNDSIKVNDNFSSKTSPFMNASKIVNGDVTEILRGEQLKFPFANTSGTCPVSNCTLPVVIANSTLKVDWTPALEMMQQVAGELHKKMTVDGKDGVFVNNHNLSVSLPTDTPVPVVLVNKSIPVEISDGKFNVTVLNVPLEVKSDSLLMGMYAMLTEFRHIITVADKAGVFISNDVINVKLKNTPVPVSLVNDSLTVRAADGGLGVFLLNTSVPVNFEDKVLNVNVQNAPLRVTMDGPMSSMNLNSTELALKIATALTKNDCPQQLRNEGISKCFKVRYSKEENRLRCICFIENKQKQQEAEVLCNFLGFDGLAARTDTGKNRETFLGLLKDLTDIYGVRAGEYYIAPNPERTCEIFSAGLVFAPKSCAEKRNFACEKSLF